MVHLYCLLLCSLLVVAISSQSIPTPLSYYAAEGNFLDQITLYTAVTPGGKYAAPNFTSGYCGQGFDTAVPDKLNLGSIPFGSGDFTISFWANPDELFFSPDAILQSRSSCINNQFWEFSYITGTTIKFEVDGSDETDYVTLNATIPRNTWTNIAAVRSGATVGLYINAVLKVSAPYNPQSTTNFPNNVTLGFGACENDQEFVFSGVLDEIRFYNVAVPANQLIVACLPQLTSATSATTAPIGTSTTTSSSSSTSTSTTSTASSPTVTSTSASTSTSTSSTTTNGATTNQPTTSSTSSAPATTSSASLQHPSAMMVMMLLLLVSLILNF